MRIFILCISIWFLTACDGISQTRVAFWNIENLYDTINDPDVNDNEFTPEGRYRWNTKKYDRKVKRIKEVIGQIKPDIMGFCEIENEKVIEDILPTGFQYVHYDSDDWRGIDVALIYDPTKVKLLRSEPIKPYGTRRTRDLLRVDVEIEGTEYMIVVVHLPSRRGNDPRATKQRELIGHQIDSLSKLAPRVIMMGDFNQNPSKALLSGLHNASSEEYKRGKGSYAYRDVWQMYDQIFVSNVLRTNAKVYSKGLIQKDGRFRGYPAKGKPSDHLPVYVDLD